MWTPEGLAAELWVEAELVQGPLALRHWGGW